MAGLRLSVAISSLVLTAAAAFAQRGEVGGLIGYGWYNNGTVSTPNNGSVTAGIRSGIAAGVVVGEDAYEHLSGEVQYLFQDGHPFVSANGFRTSESGQTHSIHYDLLVHIRSREARWRPFIAGGAGAKYYRPTGPSFVVQPFPGAVTLTNRTDWEFLATIGGGVKYRVRDHLLLRAEFLDFITPFPRAIFVPGRSGSDRGIFNQFTPMVGASYWF